MGFLVQLFFLYVAVSLAFTLLGLPHALYHRKYGMDCLRHAAAFGFSGLWGILGRNIAHGVSVLIDRLDGDKDGDGSWRDAPQKAPRQSPAGRVPARRAS